MESCLVRFLHCGRDIMVCGSVPEECPLCGQRLSGCRLQDAPVSLPSPLCNGHNTSCSFLLAPALENIHRVFDGSSDLHTGISDTKGVVYNYTSNGVRRDQSGWERCVSVPLVQSDSFSLRDQWDRYLERFSGGSMWDPAWRQFDEDDHNCYSFCLAFVNSVLLTEGHAALTHQQFTQRYILPHASRASRYSALCRLLKEQAYYLVETDGTGETDEERKTGLERERD